MIPPKLRQAVSDESEKYADKAWQEVNGYGHAFTAGAECMHELMSAEVAAAYAGQNAAVELCSKMEAERDAALAEVERLKFAAKDLIKELKDQNNILPAEIDTLEEML